MFDRWKHRARAGRALGDLRGGLLLDAVLALVVIALTAFALAALGVSFSDVLTGVQHFFGE